MLTDLYYYEAPGLNPYRNQALEEYLLRRVKPGELILYLWQNQRTVVIGRNQNAWRECRVERLRQDFGHLARRFSGGGAVFHDLGNVNFTFLTTAENYCLARQMAVICRALKQLGVPAAVSGRNDLLAAGRKISGNAFYKSGAQCYHHGTIMVDVDLDDLACYLQPPQGKLASKGISSVRSRVANLSEFAPGITASQLKALLRSCCGEAYALPVRSWLMPQDAAAELDRLTSRYAAWSWIYGRNDELNIQLSHRFEWGEVMLNLSVEQGMISDVVIYSDIMESELIAVWQAVLSGSCYQAASMARNIRQAQTADEEQTRINAELASWLDTVVC